jgi:propanol-preferring alcohol dehydrogenase
MLAVRIVSFGAPLEAFELDDVSPRAGEVKIDVAASGICHSDAHYRSGFGAAVLPRTPGHETAGIISEVGEGVVGLHVGDRVAVHYLISCGTCGACRDSGEQFCNAGEMVGKHRDGGYAESIVVPAINAVPVPGSVPLDIAAVMMCSTATAYHALRVARFARGERVLFLGFGGLGVSGLEVARAIGAATVGVVDVVPEKLAVAERRGALAIDGRSDDLTRDLRASTNGRGFDVAVDFTGRPHVSLAALRALAPGGRLVLVALSETPFTFNPYRDILGTERTIVGCSDHLREELVDLLNLAAEGRLDIAHAISSRVPLEAGPINAVLDALEAGTATLRNVIVRSV